jgi:hypothetical protein
MPSQSHVPKTTTTPGAPAPSTFATPGLGARGGSTSNEERIAQLRAGQAAGEVRADPAPWAAQGRTVDFRPERDASLFRDGATASDVVQGRNGNRYLGDCWLLASLASIAQSQPGVLEQAITDHGDGTYTVRLFREEAGGSMVSEDVRVTGAVPRTADGKDAYAQRQDRKELWVVVVQKAFAAWKKGYGALDSGVPTEALTALTGKRSATAHTRGADPAALQKTLLDNKSARKPMVAASGTDFSLGQTGIVPGHAHSVLDVSEEGGQTWVTVRDSFAAYEPAGNGAKDGVFRLPLAEFQKRFQYFSWAETGQP